MLYKNKILKLSFVTFYDPLAWKWSRSYSYSPAEHTGPKKSACTCIIIRINWARRNNKKIKSTHTHTHLMALCPGLPEWDSTSLDITEARDSEWQWHQLGHIQVCTSLQRDNHTNTPQLSFLQAGCPSCRPTNSVKALKAREKNK